MGHQFAENSLAIDIGNSCTKYGLYSSKKLIRHGHWKELIRHDTSLWKNVRRALISSVVPSKTREITAILKKHGISFLVLNKKLRLNIKIKYKGNLGSDRIAAACGAKELYGAPVIIVNLGTATVIDAVDRDNNFSGGIIAPGLGLSAEILSAGTAQLPKINPSKPRTITGENTCDAIQAGVYYSATGLINEIVPKLKSKLGKNTVVTATGGYAGLIANDSRLISKINTYLVLDGIRVISELNQGGK